MKKLIYPLAFALTAFLILYSCSPEEETKAPTSTVQSTTPEPEPETPAESQDDAIEAYRMVLETVWVDGILDPGEVHLLAKRREDLGISFEKHLEMVREMLG